VFLSLFVLKKSKENFRTSLKAIFLKIEGASAPLAPLLQTPMMGAISQIIFKFGVSDHLTMTNKIDLKFEFLISEH
jgi:hypothetical protein